MTNDLLELAANALGRMAKYGKVYGLAGQHHARSQADLLCDNDLYWNPLIDDGDALRLAVALGFINPGCWPSPAYEMELLLIAGNPDWQYATRLAIVKAAAQLGKNSKYARTN